MSVNIGLSIILEIGGQQVPLVCPSITDAVGEAQPVVADQKAALQAKIKTGIQFGLPQGTTVDINIGHLVEWVSSTVNKISDGSGSPKDIMGQIGTTLPIGGNGAGSGSSKLDELVVRIEQFHVNTKGSFNIALSLVFSQGLDELIGLDSLKKIIEVDQVGFSLSYQKETTTETQPQEGAGTSGAAKSNLAGKKASKKKVAKKITKKKVK